MTRTHSILALAVSLLAATLSPACGDDPGPVAVATRPDAPPPPDPTLYALHSQLDLASNLPGKVGDALGVLIAATDDPDDPTRYLVDQIVARMSAGTLKDVAQAAEPFVTAYVNERLLASSPQLLSRLISLGRAFGDAARDFGTMDTLEIARDGSATHALVGVRVELDGEVVELGFADHGLPVVSAAVAVTDSAGRMTLAPHRLGLSLGRTLRLVLDGAIVPHVDPGAVDLTSLLQGSVDCVALGGDMASALGFGSADAYASACGDALTEVATTIYSELDAADADALELDLAGTAEAVSNELADGTWTGTVSYAGTPAPLAGGTFSGARVE